MSSNAVKRFDTPQVFQEFAEVVAVSAEGAVVRTPLAVHQAKRALSCIVALQQGDRVLLATEEGGDSFVLAVLSRKPEAQGETAIEVPGNLKLRAKEGKVTVAAREGVELLTPQRLLMTASEVVANAVDVKVASQHVELFSTRLDAELLCVRAVTGKLDSVCQRVRSQVGQAYRTVTEIDQLRAAHIDYKADGNAHLRAENTLVTARDLVKLNADQVHIS